MAWDEKNASPSPGSKTRYRITKSNSRAQLGHHRKTSASDSGQGSLSPFPHPSRQGHFYLTSMIASQGSLILHALPGRGQMARGRAAESGSIPESGGARDMRHRFREGGERYRIGHGNVHLGHNEGGAAHFPGGAPSCPPLLAIPLPIIPSGAAGEAVQCIKKTGGAFAFRFRGKVTTRRRLLKPGESSGLTSSG